MTRLAICFLAACVATATGGTPSVDARASSLGDSVTINDIRVTLLDAGRASLAEVQRWTNNPAVAWKGGAIRLAFLVENRPGAPIAPVLGEIKVFFDGQSYNRVTNATSTQPFAPDIKIRTVGDFLATNADRQLHGRVPSPRSGSIAGILDIVVRGDVIPPDARGIVELEQGETHRPDARGRLRALVRDSIEYSWFRFHLPQLD